MRICCITKDIFSGGAGKSLYVVATIFAQEHKVFILSKNRSNEKLLKKSGIEHSTIKSGFYPFHYLSGSRKPMLLNYVAWFMRGFSLLATLKKIQEFEPDIVVVNGFQCLWYVPFLGKRIKVILFARELLNWHRLDAKLVSKIINKHVNCVIAITENEADQLSEVKPPIHVVYNSYDGEFSGLPGKDVNTTSDIKIGVFGTIHQVKGQYLIIDLVEKYLSQIRELKIKFIIYGGRSKITTRTGGREELIRAVKKKKLEDYILFPGWVSNTNAEMKKMNIVLRTDMSGCPWGRDIIEAMSNAKPVIASGFSEVFINHAVTGMLYPPGDIDKMANHIFSLAQDREQREKIGEAAYTFARENFDATKNAQSILNIFKDLLS